MAVHTTHLPMQVCTLTDNWVRSKIEFFLLQRKQQPQIEQQLNKSNINSNNNDRDKNIKQETQ